ncbi:phage tail tape measure protein [Streptomyces racemochromogenes]|uniref:phage tail tape measure protein n=1 Tax=Streptomyces racemochromogenes TaxID=67353 RepID=UPI0031E4ED67
MASDTSLVFNLIARDRASGVMDKVSEKFTASAAAIGAGVGAALGTGIANAMDVGAANDKLAAQLGVGPAEAADLAKVSASVYANAWGDSTETVNQAIRGVYQNIGDTSKATGGLEAVTTKALALASTFDQEVGGVTAAVGQLMRTGLADSADEAFDIITAGFQSSANKADDLLDTINEYSTQFRRVGLDGQTSIGLISQAMAAGARDADQVADAIGQFGELALAGGKPVEEAFKSIGLNAGTMAKMIGQGGTQAEKALQLTTDALRNTKDHQTQLNAATALFGDPGTVMGKALFALNPATAAAAAGMDHATGATDRLIDTVGDNASSKLEAFKRQALSKLTEVGAGFITFAMAHQTTFQPLAYTLLGLAATVLVVRGAMMVYSTISAVVAGANAIISASAWTVIGNWLRMTAIGLGAYVQIAAGAVASAATTAAAWVGSALTSIGTWVLAVIRAGAVAAMQFLLMAARAVAWAAVMAAQWLIAMGPIGWIIMAVAGLVTLIVMYWDQIKAWTGAAWDWVWQKIQSFVSFVVTLFMNFTLVGLIASHWESIKSTAVAAWDGLVAWIRGIPGMIFNALMNFTPIGLMAQHWQAIKDTVYIKALQMMQFVTTIPGRISGALSGLGGLLVDKGRDLVSGLWRGIQAMGGWLRSTLMSWARNLIPGPIAKALGIASPSKLMADQIGQWIPAGVVVGIEARQGEVDAAMAGLVQPPGSALASAAGQQVAGGGTAPLVRPGFGPQQQVTVRFDFGGAEGDLQRLMRKSVRIVGQGNVQAAFGQ